MGKNVSKSLVHNMDFPLSFFLEMNKLGMVQMNLTLLCLYQSNSVKQNCLYLNLALLVILKMYTSSLLYNFCTLQVT